MIAPFEFATSARIIFGAGKLSELPVVVRPFGERVLLVVGSSLGRAEPAVRLLRDAGCAVEAFQVACEPTIELVEEGTVFARTKNCDVVVGFGGGSVIDAAKAISALANNREAILTYLEVIGEGRPIMETSLPFIAVPTTSGTGAEVTRNAVLHSEEHNVKVSLRSPMMLPVVALVDPETSVGLPPELTAATGMDALTQLIEPFLSCRSNVLTDAICLAALPRVAGSLERAFTNGDDLVARTNMAYGSLSSGLALANSGLGAVHGFAAPIGGMFRAPHGAVCAALLPIVLDLNLRRVMGDPTNKWCLDRYQELARIVTGNTDATPQGLIGWVAGLRERLEIPRLSIYGIRSSDFSEIATKAAGASSMKGNPVALSHGELIDVLAEAV